MISQPRDAAPGMDLRLLEPWLEAVVPDVTGPLSVSLIPGGKSNLTYLISDGRAQEWVVRRPPLGHVLATAHDMRREYDVMTALRPTPVPVPATFAICDDSGVLGAPFYVMERVHGTPYRAAADLRTLGPARTRAISTRLIEALATLHQVDIDVVGLTDFGRPDGYLGRQLVRWKKQFDASRSRDLPFADRLHSRLSAHVPVESAATVVHGDFRLDNILMGSDDQATAVLDWEMATLGDPFADLALMLTYHSAPQEATPALGDAALAPGFLTQAELLDCYATTRGCELRHFGFYMGLAAYKLAAILEGVHFRHVHGQTVGDGFETVGGAVATLLEVGLEATRAMD